jgi:hypothetical protein
MFNPKYRNYGYSNFMVKDALTNNAVSSATLHFSRDGDEFLSAKVKGDGSYLIYDVRGDVEVYAEAPGYLNTAPITVGIGMQRPREVNQFALVLAP